MPTPATAVWPRPKSEDEFEDIVLDALRELWSDPHATRLGRRGQAQGGIDIVGNDAVNAARAVAAQCKNVEALGVADVEAIATKAEAYNPAPTELVVVISGPRDAKLQQAVQSISGRRTAAGGFGVRLLFWDDVCGVISAKPELVAKHWQGWNPHSAALLAPPQTHVVSLSPKVANPTTAPSTQPFAIVPEAPAASLLVPGVTAGAVALLSQCAWLAQPTREVIVVPYSTPQSLLGKTNGLQLAQAAQLWTRRGQPMFPMAALRSPQVRSPRGMLWEEQPGPGWHSQFAQAFDGSLGYREMILESGRTHPIWGTGVGLFSTLDRVIGAVLFSRHLLRGLGPSRSWLVVNLTNVAGQRLAFDYDDSPRAAHVVGGPFVTHLDSFGVGLNFDLNIADADVINLAAAVGEELAYYFSWLWRKDWVMPELEKIVAGIASRA